MKTVKTSTCGEYSIDENIFLMEFFQGIPHPFTRCVYSGRGEVGHRPGNGYLICFTERCLLTDWGSDVSHIQPIIYTMMIDWRPFHEFIRNVGKYAKRACPHFAHVRIVDVASFAPKTIRWWEESPPEASSGQIRENALHQFSRYCIT